MTPPRGFPVEEFEQRLEKAQRLMRERDLDALLLTTEPEFRYFSGFHSEFWQSPTRPWYLVVPAAAKPIAVIPTIGLSSMSSTWVEDIRTWSSPNRVDDGVTLVGAALRECGTRIGVPMGAETHVRLPQSDFDRIRNLHAGTTFTDATAIVRTLRMVKSEREIDKIRHVCQCVSSTFENLPGLLHKGMTEIDVFRVFKTEALRCGVDATPYLVGAAGPDGGDDIIKRPSERRLRDGDAMILDTGCVFDGYYCDFDRNYAFGVVSQRLQQAYEVVHRATDAGFAAVRPGATTDDLWAAMQAVLLEGGSQGDNVGRYGHGLGMQLTEWPSNMPGDGTVLEAGMVLTLEPGMVFGEGQLMVHEENLVVRDDGAEYLTRRAPAEIYCIEH